MKRVTFLLFIVVCILNSCNQTKRNINSNSQSSVNNKIDTDFVSKTNSKIEIDTFQLNDTASTKIIKETDKLSDFINHSDSIALLANKYLQFNINDTLKKVKSFKNDSIDTFYASYSIYKEDNITLFISESPYSDAGDFYWINQYFFYKNGNLRLYTTSYFKFDDRVPGGAIKEELYCYFDQNSKLIKKKYRFMDKENKNIDFRKLEVIPEFYETPEIRSLKDLLIKKPFLNK